MILHLSRKLARRLRCELSFEGEKVAQTGRLDSWSADLLTIPKSGSFALVMHDASLWPILVPVWTRMSYEVFLEALLLHIAASYATFGASFDCANQTVIATKRSNRGIIGSMNEAIFLMKYQAESMQREQGAVDWATIRADIARTPFSSVKGHFPDRRFAELLAG